MPSMANFANLGFKSKDTAIFTLYGVELVGSDGQARTPTLTVRHAGESNKPYFNEMLRRAEHLARRKAKVTVELIKDNRERDRDLYPQHVVIGWNDVVDASGHPVSFNKEDCKTFLSSLPDDMFDELREFCREAQNFRETTDGGAAAGNSRTA